MANGGSKKKAVIWSLLIGIVVGVAALAATPEMGHSTPTPPLSATAPPSMQSGQQGKSGGGRDACGRLEAAADRVHRMPRRGRSRLRVRSGGGGAEERGSGGNARNEMRAW